MVYLLTFVSIDIGHCALLFFKLFWHRKLELCSQCFREVYISYKQCSLASYVQQAAFFEGERVLKSTPRTITICCEAAAKLTELNAKIDMVLQAVGELDVVKQQGKGLEEARKEILAMKSL